MSSANRQVFFEKLADLFFQKLLKTGKRFAIIIQTFEKRRRSWKISSFVTVSR